MSEIENNVLAILEECRVDGNKVYLPDIQLDRTLYNSVNDVLTRLLGKWVGGKTSAHVFPYDFVGGVLTAVVESGIMPEKNPLAYFPTPDAVIDTMFLGIDTHWSYTRILEPSAGMGAISSRLKMAFSESQIDTVELSELNRTVLKERGFSVVADDFLSYSPAKKYHLVVMNPPFSVKDDKTAYITHIYHAWEMLEPGGKLVAIVPPGWTYGRAKKVNEFRKFVSEFGEFELLDKNTFKESGTLSQTMIIWLTKDEMWRREVYQGYVSHHAWEAQLYLENDRFFYDKFLKIADNLVETGEVDRAAFARLYEELESKHPGKFYLLPEDINWLLTNLQEDVKLSS